jgi:hypothetical protein
VTEGGFNNDGSYNTSDDEATDFDEYDFDDTELGERSGNSYVYEVGQTVKLGNGSQGRVIDIFDDSIEVLLPGGQTVTVDFRDAAVMEGEPLNKYRQRVQAQGFTDSPEERNADRLERKRRHAAALDRISNISGLGSEKEAKHKAQQRIARDEYDTQRRKDDDEDTRKTFDMMRDRLNRMQYKNQRDVDPKQLAKISAIKYEPIRETKNFQGRTPPGRYDAIFDPKGDHIRPGMLTKPAPGVDAKGRTQQQWIQLVKAKFPDGKMIQSKMPDGPVQVTLPDGRKLGWRKVEQDITEAAGNMTPNWAKYVLDQLYNSNGAVTMTDLFDEGIPGLHAMFMATAQEHGLDPEEEFIEVESEVIDKLEAFIKGGHGLDEAEYQGRKVQLGKPMQGDVKKSKVYVKDPKTGNVKKVNFGDPNMTIKKSNPARRKSFRARHNCDNPGPRTSARYWSCRAW